MIYFYDWIVFDYFQIFQFKRATVQDSQTGELVFAKYRISKSAWLRDNEHKIIETISQRVTDMTGLSMDTAEELQVVNYGIGGHYEPHFDFARVILTYNFLIKILILTYNFLINILI